MEFNKLTEGIVRADGSNAYEGGKMRRTEFESEAEKLAYDASGLIKIAQKALKKQNVSVAEVLDLRVRKDDNPENLRQAIALKLRENLAVSETVLSPENREFLDSLRPQVTKFMADLNGIGVKKLDTNVGQLMAVLEALGDLTLDEARTNFAQPEITLDLGQNLGKLKILINKHFNPDNKKDQIAAVYCGNPDDPDWLDDERSGEVGVFIMEGKDDIGSDSKITGKKGNWGGERDAYIDKLEAEQAKGIQVDDLLARQYLPWATVQRLVKKRPVDSQTYTLLKSKNKSPVVPVGSTAGAGVNLFQRFAVNQRHSLRRRRAVGGYVKKEQT